jgi:hypothetical protein
MSDQDIVLPPAQNAPPAAVNTVFRGPNGIRAGWRVLIYLAIMAGVLVVLAIVAFALRLLAEG